LVADAPGDLALKSNNEMLLDGIENLQRQIESLKEYETQLADRCWRAEHPELIEDHILEAEYVSSE
jgi:hypothetical protein